MLSMMEIERIAIFQIPIRLNIVNVVNIVNIVNLNVLNIVTFKLSFYLQCYNFSVLQSCIRYTIIIFLIFVPDFMVRPYTMSYQWKQFFCHR